MKDGLPKYRDFPADFGGSGDTGRRMSAVRAQLRT